MSTTEAHGIDFTVDTRNLYREEAITDFKVASIRRLVPIHADGTEDPSRSPIFIGHTELMSPEGPVPLQARLEADTFKQAMDVFPDAMNQALADMVEHVKQMQREQMNEKRENRIIVPGFSDGR
ncbi:MULTISPECIES: hypothetical protein [Desulfococcus]|jgi:hypothetical protein|uniref:Cytoplasmic protein n=1 Tax=Desulfococcus multivorans DSM 2059 TaxID=1121405 RepID=S7TWT9_DESML|nr:hypothetical protein [Desulfococcus multivorans]AOY58588.1 conserved uncharacterized protein [Desulfococcus multivorans]AQV00892.1 cytoplasmic protein [Desulfococcus multivorans]EPR41562.1 cytoplasmic protein [Desulfococcus multivorans DSM 2059]MDX9820140.1 cytoplasmic protein [Desulfococcus multivorans]SJZ43936.1 hypothetical protein SAMN02745446_00512 [Desulfococcus multivorans DSM 2059]